MNKKNYLVLFRTVKEDTDGFKKKREDTATLPTNHVQYLLDSFSHRIDLYILSCSNFNWTSAFASLDDVICPCYHLPATVPEAVKPIRLSSL